MNGPRGRMQQQPPKSKVLAKTMARISPAIGVLAFFSFFVNLLRLTIPLYLLQVIDRVVSSESYETLLFITLIAVGALIVSGILTVITKSIQSRMSIWMEQSLFEPVAKASLMGKLTNQTNGGGALRDVGQLRNFFSGQMISTFFEVPWTPIFIGIIYYLHPWLGIFSMCVAVVIFLLALLNDVLTSTKQQEAQMGQMKISKQMEQALNSFDAMRAMGMIPRFVAGIRSQSLAALKEQSSVDERGGTIQSIIRFVRSGAQVGILGLGAYLALEGEATTGSMIAASILQSLGLSPVDQSIGAVRAVKGASGAYKRVNMQLSAINMQEDKLHLEKDPELTLKLSQAMYMPQGVGRPVLRPMNFELPAGEMLGIFGPGASGKSTLCRLLSGVISPTNGSVQVNDLEVNRLAGDEFGSIVGYLPQMPEIIAGTIADNISRFGDSADPERSARIVEAAQHAGIHDVVVSLPDRYDTFLNEQGLQRLSRSQINKIFLARAFYNNPKLLILDEPSTFLDKAGDQALTDALETFRENGATIIVVTSKPKALKDCDKLLLLRDGAIADFGEAENVLANLAKGGGNPRLVEGGGQRRAG